MGHLPCTWVQLCTDHAWHRWEVLCPFPLNPTSALGSIFSLPVSQFSTSSTLTQHILVLGKITQSELVSLSCDGSSFARRACSTPAPPCRKGWGKANQDLLLQGCSGGGEVLRFMFF